MLVPLSPGGQLKLHEDGHASLIGVVAVDVVVIASIGEQRVGVAAGDAADRRNRIEQRQHRVTSLRFLPGQQDRAPCLSMIRWFFESARVNQRRARAAPPF